MGGIRQRIKKKLRRKFDQDEFANMAELFLSLRTTHELASLVGISNKAFISMLTAQYEQFTILKINGEKRLITKPDISVLEVQRRLNLYLQSVYYKYHPKNIFGSIPCLLDSNNWDARNNAEIHTGREFILNIDIKDFFNSINVEKVRNVFLASPFHFSIDVIELLCKMVTYQGSLVTGAATSTMISNFVLLNLDAQFHQLAEKYEATYSRYIDDITFSFDSKPSSDVLKNVILLLKNEGFEVAWNKFKLRGKDQRQEVNGIVINEFPNVRTSYYKELRATLYNLNYKNLEEETEKYVTQNYYAYKRSIRNYWIGFYNNQKLNINFSEDAFIKLYDSKSGFTWYTLKSVRGKLSYLGYILGTSHARYLKLLGLYHDILGRAKRHWVILKPEFSPDLAYITNATSKSVVFYAYDFLYRSGFDSDSIMKLKSDLQLNSLSGWEQKQERLYTSFREKNIHFLNLYESMNLESELVSASERFSQVEELIKKNFKYERKKFHLNPECEYLKSDYVEGVHYKNTGIFVKDKLSNEAGYFIEKEYLLQLGMVPCKKCGDEEKDQ